MREIRAEAQPVQDAAIGAGGGREQLSSTSTKVKAVKTQPTVICKESELLDIINQLKDEIAEIKGVIHESHMSSPQHRPSRKQSCRDCQGSNRGEQCDHCFKCGQSGHLSRVCRIQRKPTERSEQVDMSASTVTSLPSPSVTELSQSEQQQDVYTVCSSLTNIWRQKW